MCCEGLGRASSVQALWKKVLGFRAEGVSRLVARVLDQSSLCKKGLRVTTEGLPGRICDSGSGCGEGAPAIQRIGRATAAAAPCEHPAIMCPPKPLNPKPWSRCTLNPKPGREKNQPMPSRQFYVCTTHLLLGPAMVTSGLSESDAKSRAGPAERTAKSGEFSSCILSALLGIFTQGLCGRPCIAPMGFQTRAVRLHHLGQCWGRSGLPEIWPPIGSSRPMLLTASGGFWRGVVGLGFRVFHRLGKKNETFREGMISRAYKASSKFCNLFRSMDANTELDFDDADSWHGRSRSEISGSRPSVGWFKDLNGGRKS